MQIMNQVYMRIPKGNLIRELLLSFYSMFCNITIFSIKMKN